MGHETAGFAVKRFKCTVRALIRYIDGLVQERCNSSANALELRLFCTNPSTSSWSILQDGCLRLLLSKCSSKKEKDSSVDANGNTPAHLAAKHGHMTCLQVSNHLLISRSCNISSFVVTNDTIGCRYDSLCMPPLTKTLVSWWLRIFNVSVHYLDHSDLHSLGRHRSGSSLAQALTYYLKSTIHYLNQYWLITNEVEWQIWWQFHKR